MSLELAQVNILLRQPATTDWPNAYAIKALAYLQTWYQGIDAPAWNRTAAPWQSALHADVERGVLHVHHCETDMVKPKGRFVRSAGIGEPPAPPRPTPQPVKSSHVTAADFAQWLAGQGEQPSKLVAAWFKAQGVTEAAAVPPPAPAAEKPVTIKRQALIDKHLPRWTTVESDLNEASRNDLKKEASVAHGVWDEQKALVWAESRGKLIGGNPAARIAGHWPSPVLVHKIQG